MTKPRVLISDKMDPNAARIFAESGCDVDVITGETPEELIARIGDYDGLAIRSSTKVTKAILDAATNLKVIGRAGIGVDNVDIPDASSKGVVVMNTPFGNSITTAEHAIAMMFALARQLPEANAQTQAGLWPKNGFMGVEVTSKTLGLIGAGNIGSIVASRALGLKMKVVAYDPFLTPERAIEMGVEKADLDTLLAKADFITLHTPLTSETQEHPQPRKPRQDQEGRAHHQLRAWRPDRRSRAERTCSTAAMWPVPRSMCSRPSLPRNRRCSVRRTSSAPRTSARAPPRRRSMSRCRWLSRWPNSLPPAA